VYVTYIQLKSVTTQAEQHAQELRDETQHLREDFNKELQVTQEDFKKKIHSTRQDLETQLAAVEARTRCGGTGNVGTHSRQLKPPKFDGTMSWAIFHRQFEAAASNNGWTSCEKSAYLQTVLQRQAADTLQSPR
jgi:hypothetical protein